MAIPLRIATFFAQVYPGELVCACFPPNGVGPTDYRVPGRPTHVLLSRRHLHVYTDASGENAAINLCCDYSCAYVTACTIATVTADIFSPSIQSRAQHLERLLLGR